MKTEALSTPIYTTEEPLKTPSLDTAKLDSEKFLNSKIEHKPIYSIFFFTAGLITLFPYYIMIAQSDVFTQLYPSYDYAAYSIVPSYANIPFALISLKFLSNLRMKPAVRLCVVFQSVFISLVPLIAFWFGDGLISFILLIGSNVVAFVFNNMLQSNLIAISSNFPPKYAGLYFSSFPISNIVLLTIKLVMNAAGVSNSVDVS